MINKLIVLRRGQLIGPISDLHQDILVEIKAPRGRRRFMLLFKPVYGNKLKLEQVGALEHSINFRQSYLVLGNTVVGSVLDVSANWCKVNTLSVGYMPPQDKLYDFECPVEGQSGGMLIYRDGHGSFFAMISNLPNSRLLIKDEKDNS